MASITLRNLNDDLKRRLHVRAENGRSMEEEAREILRAALGAPSAPQNLGQSIHARFAALGGVEIDRQERGPGRNQPGLV